MYPRCPHCGGVLYVDCDGYEEYYTCFGCARSFDFAGKPTRMTGTELLKTKGIKLIESG